jgi:hypothetical protein
LLVTYSRGPACTSGVAGCGPKPHTCGAEILEISLTNAKSTVIWRVGRDDVLRDAALSPDGATLVARASPCVPSYFNDHLLFRAVETGASWTVGAGVPRCHWIGPPQWTSDGRHVLIAYAPHDEQPYAGPDGTCSGFGDNSLVRIDATHASAQVTGVVAPPRAGCTWESAAVTETTTYAIQACGGTSRVDGPAALVRLNSALRPVHRWRIGDCTDGNSLAADSSKGVVLSAYLYCPSPEGQKESDPVTALDYLDNGHLHRISSTVGGATAWDKLSW